MFIFILIYTHISRRFEYEADKIAVKVVGKEAVIKTLNKLSDLNLIPRKYPRFLGLFETHPSFEDRIKRVR